MRVFTPKRYAWKGAKWVRVWEFLAKDKPVSGKSMDIAIAPIRGKRRDSGKSKTANIKSHTHMRRLTDLLLFVALIVFSCSKQTQDTTKQEEQSPKKDYKPVPISALDPDRMVPVGMCRIIGTVVSIDSSLAAGEGGPCSKAPCTAMVRIDSVLGCGSAVANPISVGSSVRVRFAMTLSPTKELFPKLDPPLPGLRLGSRFKALIQSGAEAVGYSVDSYEAR